MTAAPWWSDAFSADYVDLYPHRDLESARVEARFLVANGLRGRVLDLCCGWGRHLIALDEIARSDGVDLRVVGVDYSFDLLRRLREIPAGQHVAPRAVNGDARCAPFQDGALDGIVSLFSSFGYFGDAGDARLLAGIARMLVPGGAAFLDVMNPPFVRAGLVPESRKQAGDASLVERRSLSGRSVRKDVELWRGDERVRVWHEEVRMYEFTELEALTAAVGLAIEASWGAFDGSALRADSPRQILRLRAITPSLGR
jgi:SAM-dependent methyltransferase